MALTPVKGQGGGPSNKDKRFKTSGLVATAVQSSHTRNKSHHHSSNGRKPHHRTINNNNNIAQRQLSSLVYTESSLEESSRNTLKIALRKTKSNSTNNYIKNKLANEQNNKRT